jgi:hypothetical protein
MEKQFKFERRNQFLTSNEAAACRASADTLVGGGWLYHVHGSHVLPTSISILNNTERINNDARSCNSRGWIVGFPNNLSRPDGYLREAGYTIHSM